VAETIGGRLESNHSYELRFSAVMKWQRGYRATPTGIEEVEEALISKSDYEFLMFKLSSLERENKTLRDSCSVPAQGGQVTADQELEHRGRESPPSEPSWRGLIQP
jgi:hypothetical protein